MCLAVIDEIRYKNTIMLYSRRQTLFYLTALPFLASGCGIRALPPVQTEKLLGLQRSPQLRPITVGQSWRYVQRNGFNSEVVREIDEVARITDQQIILERSSAGQALAPEIQARTGGLLQDPYWDFVQIYDQALTVWPQSLDPGRGAVLNTRYRIPDFSYTFWIQTQLRVIAWEKIQVAAGTFTSLHLQRFYRLDHYDFTRISTTRYDDYWFVPEIGRWVMRETRGEFRRSGQRLMDAQYEDHFRYELVKMQV